MNDFLNSLWKVKWNLLALVTICTGWAMLNIWVVIAGVVLAIAMFHQLRMAKIDLRLRLGVWLTIAGTMFGLHFFSGNGDFLLAAGVYAILAVLNPWPRYNAQPGNDSTAPKNEPK